MHRSISRAGVVLALSFGLAGPISASAFPQATSAGDVPVTASGLQITSDSPCQQVVWLAARGSGELMTQASGLGAPVYEAWLQYKAKTTAAVPKVGFWVNPYPAAPADKLLDRVDGGAARAAFTKSVDDGVEREANFLIARAGSCPTERYVLAGYSQGAMVQHRVLDRIVPLEYRSRIDGSLLIADGDRQGSNAPQLISYGTADQAGSSFGVSRFLLSEWGMQYNNPPGVDTGRDVHDVCMKDDVICDFQTDSAKGFDIHGNAYSRWGRGTYAKTGVVYVKSAATNIAKATIAWIRQPHITKTTLPAATVATPYSTTLTATGGLAPYHWKITVNKLPTGLTLSDAGTISGTPTTAQSRDFTVKVTDARGRTGALSFALNVLKPGQPWASLTSGIGHTCGVRSDGTGWCWGENGSGQLGNGTTIDSAVPAKVGTATWAALTAGASHTCGLRTDGTVWCWGSNSNGTLGNGTTTDSALPVQVGTAATWTSLSAGWVHTCGIRADRTAWCWGDNQFGEVGDGTTSDRKLVPVQVGTASTWATLTAGGSYTCGVRNDRTAWCWGDNRFGVFGNGKTTSSAVPIRVGGATTWTALVVGDGHTCGVRTDGTAWCWGLNGYGQLGNGSTTDSLVPAPVGGSATWAALTVTTHSTCGVRADGTAWCWGFNGYGQLGNGSAADSLIPVQVGNLSTWTAVTAHGGYRACGTRADRTAWCWGSNDFGQLGDGTTTGSWVPVQVR